VGHITSDVLGRYLYFNLVRDPSPLFLLSTGKRSESPNDQSTTIVTVYQVASKNHVVYYNSISLLSTTIGELLKQLLLELELVLVLMLR
jgi:hypothetical protein